MSNTDVTRVMGTPGTPVSDRTLVAPAGGATLQMPAAFDPMQTQMGGTITCPVCQSVTPLAETYCGDCGFLLSSELAAPPEMPVEEALLAELVDPADGRRYRLHAGVNTIGRQGTDILANEGTVSRVHARLTVENGSVIVEDLGSTNGTKVGDRRIGPNEPTRATHGTPLKFGNWRITLEFPGSAPADTTTAISAADRTMMNVEAPAEDDASAETATRISAPPPSLEPTGAVVAMLKLVEGSTSDIPVTSGTITFGRKAENTISLTGDPYISGRHAEVITDNTGTYLVDVGSTNGTLVNGERLTPNEKQLLLEGDEIQIGQSIFKFALLDSEEDWDEDAEVAPADEPALEQDTTGVSEGEA